MIVPSSVSSELEALSTAACQDGQACTDIGSAQASAKIRSAAVNHCFMCETPPQPL
jgi:hypothetical protein